MIVKDIIDKLLKWSPSDRECNSDNLVTGP